MAASFDFGLMSGTWQGHSSFSVLVEFSHLTISPDECAEYADNLDDILDMLEAILPGLQQTEARVKSGVPTPDSGATQADN
jgi:hypothetical protein